MRLTNLLSSLFVAKRRPASQTGLNSTVPAGSAMASASTAPRQRQSGYAVLRRRLLGQAASADYDANLAAAGTLLKYCSASNLKSAPFQAELRRLADSLSSRRASHERHPADELAPYLAEQPLTVLEQLATLWPATRRQRCTPHSNPLRYAILDAIIKRSLPRSVEEKQQSVASVGSVEEKQQSTALLLSLKEKQQSAAQAYSQLSTILSGRTSGGPMPDAQTLGSVAQRVQQSEVARSAARAVLAKDGMACDHALVTQAEELLDAPMPYKFGRNFCERRQFVAVLERLSASDLAYMASLLAAETLSEPAGALAGALADEQARRRAAGGADVVPELA